MKPDGIDAKILEALMKDGRASFRQIAQRTSLTTQVRLQVKRFD